MEFLKLFLGGAKQTDLDIPDFHYTTFQLVDKKSRHSLGTTRDLGIGNLSTVDHTGDFALDARMVKVNHELSGIRIATGAIRWVNPSGFLLGFSQ